MKKLTWVVVSILGLLLGFLIGKTAFAEVIVSITNPIQDTELRGTVDLSANVDSSFTATKVEFYADQTLIGTDEDGAPYSISWDTKAFYNYDSAYTLTAKAYNADGQIETSNGVVIIVRVQDGGNSVTPPPVPETCTDGIQNQDETGIDIGGVCGEPVVTQPVTENVSHGSSGSHYIISKVEPKPIDIWYLVKFGDKSENVKIFQQLLNSNGAKLKVDGIYGKKTLKAWFLLQSKIIK